MILLAGWGTLAMGLLIAADVLWRAATGNNFGGVDEIACYLFAIGISWSLAAAFHARAHIRVDILYRELPFIPRIALDILATLSLLIVAAFLTYSSWLVLETSWLRGARSASSMQIPLVIPQGLWLLGVLVFAASLISALTRSVLDIASGHAVAVVARHGVPTPDEEAEYAVLQSRGAS
ncbi:TRAP transporter small permease subunit [Paracoccus sp. SY]|uniref:TRAP transporter small permease subunit n=1 Tax=Paracoccus sp. SY TaxID=1330255 RepID=UPI001304D204|nr:TRAP transporter small permease [Paracoccus sp. SY]